MSEQSVDNQGWYDFKRAEAHWQEAWEREGLFRCDTSPAADAARPHFYALVMFPYPSGSLHMGHVLNYTLGDAVVRYHIMKGENVLSPIGWDALGLPAESAAVRAGTHPHDWTARNIAEMRGQMKAMGWGYDWQREVGTHTSEYYRWTQWLFLAMHERGLAYRKEAHVNWCPHHETVLANEQVVDGACERCKTPVEKKKLEQWFFRITDYAQRLLDGLDTLDLWPEKVKKRQRDWIGRSEGARVEFSIEIGGAAEALPVFTTRPDTLWGVTFMSIAPEHPLVERIVAAQPAPRAAEIMTFVQRALAQSAIERSGENVVKEGIDTGFTVKNPVNGEQVPLFVANYVLMEYGTGAVMAVPAHDQRDFEFARKYDLPVRVVIQNATGDLDAASMDAAYTDDGVQADASPFVGVPNRDAIGKIIDLLAERGWGERTVNYRLRDWLISRQRYWGVPIPMIYDQAGAPHAVPAAELPVVHPRDIAFKGSGGNPLAGHAEFVKAVVPGTARAPGRRETDTMDTFVDSSWYFCRYLSPRATDRLVDAEVAKRWLPVDLYIGGDEHAVLHLMYARFIAKVLKDLGLIDVEEPFKHLFCQGMVCREAYQLASDHAVWVPWQEVDSAKMVRRSDGAKVMPEMAKMSKSKLNGVTPDEILPRFGADVLRTYILFVGPPDRELIYQEEGLIGIDRFLKRLREVVREVGQLEGGAVKPYAGDGAGLDAPARALWRKSHQTAAAFTRAAEETFAWNTSISRLMELCNLMRATLGDIEAGRAPMNAGLASALRLAAETGTRLVAPVAPHCAEELWHLIGHEESVFRSGWPQADAAACQEEVLEIVFQVNGKLAGTHPFPPGAAKEDVKAAALASDRVTSRMAGKTVVKEVYVQDKLLNFVVK